MYINDIHDSVGRFWPEKLTKTGNSSGLNSRFPHVFMSKIVPIDCPECGTHLANVPGIGDYCPNQDCPVLDDANLLDGNGNMRSSITVDGLLHAADYITISLYTGMRRGEVLGLEKARIDLARGTIRMESEHTKSQRGRTILRCMERHPNHPLLFVPLYEVRDILGHASITQTERYSHLAHENLATAIGRL